MPANLENSAVATGLEKVIFTPMPKNIQKWSEVDQLCTTLCNPTDCSLPDSSIHGIFQARVLARVAISFSHTITLNAHASNIMHKILQARLQ